MTQLRVCFTGGAEALFRNKKNYEIVLNTGNTIADLIPWVVDNLMEDKERKGLFMQDGTVRPGLLVLVNDVDWEITGGLDTLLKDNDEVVFISTLHGG